MKVLNFGSLNLDYVYDVDHFVMAGETISSNSLIMNLGGKGFNQAVALTRAGVPQLYLAGLVGEDGLIFYDTCKDFGINTDYLKTVTGQCGHAIIQVNKSGENSIILFGGANQKNSKEYVDEVLSHFEEGDMLILQNEVNELKYIIDQAFLKGMTIVLNPSPFNEKILECDLGKVSIFLLNKVEGQQLTGQVTPSAILSFMEANYPNSRVVLTMGEGGAIYHAGNEEMYQPSFKVEVVDTTAAGDTFSGFFIASLIKKMPIREGLTIAAKAAAMAVMANGAVKSIPFMSEVELKDLNAL